MPRPLRSLALTALLTLCAATAPRAARAQRRTRARAEVFQPFARPYQDATRSAVAWVTASGVRFRDLTAPPAPDATGIPRRALAPARPGATGRCRDALVLRDLFVAHAPDGFVLGVVRALEPTCPPARARTRVLHGAAPTSPPPALPAPVSLEVWRARDGHWVRDEAGSGSNGAGAWVVSPGVAVGIVNDASEWVFLDAGGTRGVVALRNLLRVDPQEPPSLVGVGPGIALVSQSGGPSFEHWFELSAAGTVSGEVSLIGHPAYCVSTRADWACVMGAQSADVLFVPRPGTDGMPARVSSAGPGALVPAGGGMVVRVIEDAQGSAIQTVDRNGVYSAVARVEGARGASVVPAGGEGFLVAWVEGRGAAARVETRTVGFPPGR